MALRVHDKGFDAEASEEDREIAEHHGQGMPGENIEEALSDAGFTVSQGGHDGIRAEVVETAFLGVSTVVVIVRVSPDACWGKSEETVEPKNRGGDRRILQYCSV